MADLPLDGYVRVSRVGGRDQTDGFISPDVQEQAIRDWAARHGRRVIVREHELNVSGGTMDRPIFKQCMERVRAGESGGIVVYKSDRFARTLLGAIDTLAVLGEHDAAFASATEPNLDYSTPAGRAFLQMLFVFAEFLRSNLKESWHATQVSATERGIHISPGTYLGFDKAPGKPLAPNAQAPLAVEVFERRGRGEAWGAIAAWLNEAAPREDGQWNDGAVRRLVGNRVYRGEASRYVKQNKDGRDPIVNKDAHPALVDEATWQAAQAAPGRPGVRAEAEQLLSGVVRCAGCRYRLSKGKGPGGEPLYRCRNRHASGTCPEPASIMLEPLNAYVDGIVADALDVAVKAVPNAAERQEIADRIAEAEAAIEDFRRDTAARKRLGADWAAWLEPLQDDLDGYRAELARLDQDAEVVELGLAADRYRELPLTDRRAVIGRMIDAVFVRRGRGRGRHVDALPDRTRIVWHGEAPADLPRQRVRSTIRPFDFAEHDAAAGAVPLEDASEGS
jgi:site-specific DNA recombinase